MSAQVATPRTRVPALVLVWSAVTLLVLGIAAPLAGAHAVLLDLSPAPEQILEEPPERIRLEFNEAVTTTPDSIRLFDPSGREIRDVDLTAEGAVVSAAVPDLDVQGSYTVSWKVVSADGHSVRGAYLFHLGGATLTEPVDVGGSGSAVADVLRAVGTVVALLGLVACVRAALVAREGSARVGRWLAVVLGTVVGFVGAMVAVDTTWSGALDVVLATTSGRFSLAAVLLAVLGAVLAGARVPWRVEVVAAVLATLAIALQGHAVSLDPVGLSASMTAVHVLAAVAWIAGLVWIEHRSRGRDAAEIGSDVARFTRWALVALVSLIVSGVVLLADRVPLGEWLDATYGRIGLVKLVLLAVAVVLAVQNRATGRRLGDLDDVGDADAGTADELVGSFRRRVRVEVVVLALALVAGAVLAQVPPPGAGSETGVDGLFDERMPFGEGELQLTVEPVTRGVNEIHIIALGPDGRLMPEADTFTVGFELPADDIGPIEPDLQRVTGGHSMAYVRLPFAGEWTVTVRSRVDDFTELDAQFELSVGS